MIKSILFFSRRYKSLFFLTAFAALIVSCANMASPTGGDYDLDPPIVVRSKPEFNALNVTSNKIEIEFDELVQIEDPLDKVIITPPQRRMPVIQAISKKVRVELRDTLLPNTTYTIDFTDAIVDNNEKNPLENFSISFSTGETLDSLIISGKVLTANNLEPVKGIYVGIHSDLSDSAFLTKPFERISRTNDRGEFRLRGIAQGSYRLYALEDLSRSYKYENPAYQIAFLDSIVVPSFETAFRTDTVYNENQEADSVKMVSYTKFLPDDIVLRSFTSPLQRQYFQKHLRPEPNRLEIYFGAPTEMPEIKPLNFSDNYDWAVLERSVGNDTLNYWLTDSEIIKMDTLVMQVTYNMTDTLNRIVSVTDTLNFVDRTKRNQKKDSKKKNEDEIEFLPVQTNISPSMNVYDTVSISFTQPIYDFDENKFHLQRLVDSTYVDEVFTMDVDSLNPRKYSLRHKWLPDGQYKLIADSASFHSYYGLWNNKIEQAFRIKKLEEYGNLYINILGIDPTIPAFVELLGSGDNALRKVTVKNGGVLFRNLPPGKYYTRIILDKNNNGIWDTGDYYEKRQPEMVYYYNSFFEIKAMWDIEETWSPTSVELDKQKPLEITKNKPKEKETKRQQLEKQEEKERQSRQNQQNNQFQPGSNRRGGNQQGSTMGTPFSTNATNTISY